MSEGTDSATVVFCEGIFDAASPSLQNCFRFSSSGKYLSFLCDFGSVSVGELKETSNKLTFTAIKKLRFGKGELLEGHAWSSDDQVFAVAGCKIYLFQVFKQFSRLHAICLYYIPKDISLILQQECSSIDKLYCLAVAGPNGVELHSLEIGDNIETRVSSSLHADLAIALVEFSFDKEHLAVAALDGHFGVWSTASLETDQKEFWFVHLKTVRITSIEFSPDSQMVAVACWEGSWYSYQKTLDGGRISWMEVHHEESIAKVSGDLPGSFISWSSDSRFIRTSCSQESKVRLSTFDTLTSVTTVNLLDEIVKGLVSFRGSSAYYSLCFSRSRRFFAIPWPEQNRASVESRVVSSRQTQLLYQESFEGSVLVELSTEGEVTFRGRQSVEEFLTTCREISNERVTMIAKENEIYDSQSLTKGEGSVIGGNCREDKHELADELRAKVTSKSDETQRETSEDLITPQIVDNRRSVHPNANAAENIKEMVLGKAHPKNENNMPTEELEFQVLETSSKFRHAQESTKPASKSPPVQQNILSSSDKDGHLSDSLEREQSLENSSAKDNVKGEDICKSAKDAFHVTAPFINPKMFQCSGVGSSLFKGCSVQLTTTTNYLVVVALPLLAYVYHLRKEEWRTLLFRRPVKNCCLVKDKYLVLLSNDGRIRIFCLQAVIELYSSNKVDVTCDPERCIMTGNPFKPQFSIIDLDKRGKVEVIRVTIQHNSHGDTSVLMNHLSVCFTDLGSHRRLTQSCWSIGQLIIFKEKNCDQTSTCEEMEHCPLKWVVIVPELQISRAFLEERDCSLERFVMCHNSALMKLNVLATSFKKKKSNVKISLSMHFQESVVNINTISL
ncbi:uncharacterized protein [Acropora muricata]|uniref:uncharacterized protein isoform X3 n=1 Tax=Acropora muricata TaxID=159855 RepID=UPI0034E5CDFA